MKKILILGGGGFIGSNIQKYLLSNEDCYIDVVDNFSRNPSKKEQLEEPSKVKDRLNIINIDLTILSNFEKLRTDYDHVYMLAAMVGVDKVNSIPHEVIRVNTMLTMNTLEWLKASNCKRVLYSSTSEAYAGTVEAFDYRVPTEESVPLTIEDISHPRFTYAVTKILGESGFINYAKQGFFEAVIVRYHNVYGPMMGFRHVIPHLVERFIKKEDPFLIYGHDQTRAFNFIDDAVYGTVQAMNKGINGEIYHIGDDIEISIEDLTKFVGSLLSFEGKYKAAPTFPGSVSRRCPNIDKAKKDLYYSPQTSWKDGVKETVNWYIDFIKNNREMHESFYDQYGVNK
tara:strand:+ start:564 stop:1589 length:1026 start_codon:yes stop_codon:yes gene_type:complete